MRSVHPSQAEVRLKCHSDEKLQVCGDISPCFKNHPRIDLQALTLPLMALVLSFVEVGQ